MRLVKNEDAFIDKADSRRLGPYRANFAGGTIFINDQNADIDVGDEIVRILPSGKEEIKTISECNFYSVGIGGRGPHFQIKADSGRNASRINSSNLNQTFNIHGGQIQIGNENKQEIFNNFQTLIKAIDESPATNEEKEEAKSRLKKFLEHPLVTTIAGSAIGSLLGG
ncbi:Uncharacterised protein [Serratia quinivorans]|uniref:hypothetical protein n=1 Tax=Serratia quinivorans TaxID=137545 RepID=UPI00217BB190|nr:hypothetical protein [Serratia quinivorans]CAI1513414.1 Uncharacterised protein [Serratia quinivorans]